MNRLWYAHTATAGVKGHDNFRFHLSDLQNESPPQSFYISLPSVHRGQNGGATASIQPLC